MMALLTSFVLFLVFFPLTGPEVTGPGREGFRDGLPVCGQDVMQTGCGPEMKKKGEEIREREGRKAEALERQPDYLFWLGMTYDRSGRRDDARQCMEEVVVSDPDDIWDESLIDKAAQWLNDEP